MKYIKYNVELNGQIFSVELAENNWLLSHELNSNKIPFTKEVLKEERNYDYYKDSDKF